MSETKQTQEPESAKKHGDELDSLVPVNGHEEAGNDGDRAERMPAPKSIK